MAVGVRDGAGVGGTVGTGVGGGVGRAVGVAVGTRDAARASAGPWARPSAPPWARPWASASGAPSAPRTAGPWARLAGESGRRRDGAKVGGSEIVGAGVGWRAIEQASRQKRNCSDASPPSKGVEMMSQPAGAVQLDLVAQFVRRQPGGLREEELGVEAAEVAVEAVVLGGAREFEYER